MVGSEAQMMATLHSMADQVAAPTLSSVVRGQYLSVRIIDNGEDVQVGSVDFEMTSRLFRRMIVVTVTLEAVRYLVAIQNCRTVCMYVCMHALTIHPAQKHP